MKRNRHRNQLQIGEQGHLSDLTIGQTARVLALHTDDLARRRRLLDMGITSGVLIKVKRIAPLGDPIGIYLRGYELLVRREDMANIDIEVVQS
ncbi:MAG TPA: ferrous iron transport protein A [Firmicutes bacterium]|jgi:ferrous iron transport protein A|nr:ferrous iron transport protein A [Bacillota bacterium]